MSGASSDKVMDDMSKLVHKMYQMSDAEPFRAPVDWNGLGLWDYPEIIKTPMDLGTIQKKLTDKAYPDVHAVAQDVRQVFANCMRYNADGSDFYLLAQSLAKKFQERFQKLLQDHSLSSSSSSTAEQQQDSISLEEKKNFARSLYKLTKEELGKILVELDAKCPVALVKNSTEDEVELNVDKITPDVFHELVQYANACVGKKGTNNNNNNNNNKPKKKQRT